MSVHPSLLILLIGFLYTLGFGLLSAMRQQGLSGRFALEGTAVTIAWAALVYLGVPLHPLLFLIVIYLLTMRVRLLVDLANGFIARRKFGQALGIHRFALSLWPDPASRQIVLINRGVAQLGAQDPEAAYATLSQAVGNEETRIGARYLAAGYYNLGWACRRTGREAEAVRHFNQAITVCPHSTYARAAQQALKK